MAEPRVISAAEWEYTDALCWYAQRSRRAAEGFDAEFDKALTQSRQIRFGFRYATIGTDFI